MTKLIQAIVAVQSDGGIGAGNKLLFHIPSDLKLFKEKTLGGVLIMGRKTWESLPNKRLPGRTCVVISSSSAPDKLDDSIYWVNSPLEALQYATKLTSNKVWVIGGASVYSQLLKYCNRLHLTKINSISNTKADAFFPELGDSWEIEEIVQGANLSNEPDYSIITLVNRNVVDMSI